MAEVETEAVPFYRFQLPLPRKFAASVSLAFALVTSMLRFTGNNVYQNNIKFYQNRPRIKLVLTEKYKIFERWELRPHIPKQPPPGADCCVQWVLFHSSIICKVTPCKSFLR